jgi:ADP-ribosylglycohydrolase
MSAPTFRDRVHGCLLGGAAGDALGAPVEFMRRSEILARIDPAGIRAFVPAYGRLGAITDDTQMTLFTAEGLLRAWVRGATRGSVDPPSVVAHAYLRWLHTQGIDAACPWLAEYPGWLVQEPALHANRAPGHTCVTALRAMAHFGQTARNGSKGCGGVMRAAPVGLYAARAHTLAARTFQLGVDTAAVTHGHPTGQLTAGVLAVVVQELCGGAALDDALDVATACLTARAGHAETLDALDRARALARDPPQQPAAAIAALGQGWVAEEALAIAVYCALIAPRLQGGRAFQEGIVLAVNHDGDSDSTGAITGNLLGAQLGVAAIPDAWLEPLELRDAIAALADDLVAFPDWPLDGAGPGDAILTRYPPS